MIRTLENENLIVSISDIGAELVSIKNRNNGKEYIWYGDSTIWKWHAPVLFPICGEFKDGFTIDGKKYFLPRHGFLREKVHDFTSDGYYIYKAEREENYPFYLEAKTSFILSGNTLIHRLTIKNTGKENMPYSMGFHTGFLLSNATLEFEKEEKGLSGKIFNSKENKKELEDAVLLYNLASHSLVAKSEDGKIIKLKSPDFTTLVLWSAPNSNNSFIAIEPRIDTTEDGAIEPFKRMLYPKQEATIEEIIEIVE